MRQGGFAVVSALALVGAVGCFDPDYSNTECSDNQECPGNKVCAWDGRCYDPADVPECGDGYREDGDSCVDIDECAEETDNCDEAAVCTNTEGSFTCECKDGYSGDGTSCTDIDECEDELDNCHDDATCTNTPGGFTCECNNGYEGDGVTCTPTGCLSAGLDCDENADCIDDGGVFSCECKEFYEGDGETCTDIDECLTDNGGCGDATYWDCENNEGAAPTCSDIDECATDNGGCGDATYWDCENNEGAVPTCSDIDECATDNGGCGSATYWDCDNNEGAAPTCSDIDECATDNGGCGSATYWDCDNNEGAAPTCTDIDECATDNGGCGSATYWDCHNNEGAAPTCTDIDECALGTDNCDANAYCGNVDNGFTCTCKLGYTGDGVSCDVSPYIAIAAGEQHTCGLRGDDSVWCWGANALGQVGNGTSDEQLSPVPIAGDFAMISAGGANTCGITLGGQLWCWGYNGTSSSQTPVLVGSDWDYVDASAYHRCAIKSDHSLYCWGFGTHGELGDGTTDNHSSPVAIGSAAWSTVAGGAQFTCGIQVDGSLWCWGSNSIGKLGVGDYDDRLTPTQVGTETDWTAIAPGNDHACGLRTDLDNNATTLWCWGSNSVGQAAGAYGNTPGQVGSWSDWRQVTAQGRHTCGIRAGGGLYCWGDNEWGGLGIGSNDNQGDPQPVGDVSGTWLSVSAGFDHTCALRSDDTLHCFGHNGLGQLGIGLGGDKLVPTPVSGSWSAVAGGEYHGCAIAASDGRMWCWGLNSLSDLGPTAGATGNEHNPIQTDTVTGYSAVELGRRHSCGLTGNTNNLICFGDRWKTGNDTSYADLGSGWEDFGVGESHTCGISGGALSCWGYNSDGQLGNGTTSTGEKYPVPIGSATDWMEVAGGGYHTCGIRSQAGVNQLWCWGTNNFGQLGDGTTTQRLEPTLVGTDTDWIAVSGNETQTCALKYDHSLYCWGGGYIGDGASDGSTTPVQIGSATDWQMISLGGAHACGLRGGELWCWGSNNYGQLGDGTTEHRPSPTRIGSRTDWATIHAAKGFTCATTTSDELYCWGAGSYGQLGNGEAARWTPVEVPL